MICKVAYHFRRTSCNDEGTLRQGHDRMNLPLLKPVIRICPSHFGQTMGSTC
jgi:hypothetical protein